MADGPGTRDRRPVTDPDDPRVERRPGAAGAHLDLRDRLSYGQYLHLDDVLGAQQPRTDAHDEVLFIVQHQTTELWLKLVLHELHTVAALIEADDLQPAFKSLARVDRVLQGLISSWDVLTTMTPADYLSFRAALDTSSGFQSFQFRELEFVLGNRDALYLEPFRHEPERFARLESVLREPSLYDRTIRLLARRGLPVDAALAERDWSEPHRPDRSVLDAWLVVYRSPEAHWDLYELGEELLDLEDAMRQWRLRHVTTVERIIGLKTGTGGTAGVPYLRTRLEVVLFPELWNVRTEL
jgi:tryptophan 2,3-dioxygenase